MSEDTPRQVRSLAFGIVVIGALLYMFLFASAASIQVVMLIAVAAVVVWFATVEPLRLVDHDLGLNRRLFGLGAIGLALLVSTMAALTTGTTILTLGLGLLGLVVGAVRAIRFSMHAGR